MNLTINRRRALRGGLLALSLPLLEALQGCGGGGSAPSVSNTPNNAPEYQNWLNATLAEQTRNVGDATANFVELKATTNTNFTTSLLGWIRRASDSSVDQLWRWSADPAAAQAQLNLAINKLGLAGTTINLASSFNVQRDGGIGIPLLKAVVELVKKKSASASFEASISYASASVTWISDAALKLLLASSQLSAEFLDQVARGEVTLYRGAIALSGVKIALKTASATASEFSVGSSFVESGLSLKVESKGSGSQNGEILLAVEGDLFVGIDSRVLKAEDIGRKAATVTTTVGGETVQQWVTVDETFRNGTLIVQNQSTRVIAISSAVVLKWNDAVGNRLCSVRYFSDTSVRPQSFEGFPIDLSGLSLNSRSTLQPFVLSGFPTTSLFLWSGIKGGSVVDRTASGSASVIEGMHGLVSTDGKFLFHHYLDSRFVMEGKINPDLTVEAKSIFGDFSSKGSIVEYPCLRTFEFPIPNTKYIGIIEIIVYNCSGSSY